MRTAIRRVGHVLARAAGVVSALLVGLDGRPQPPAARTTPPEQHRP